jgi:hypothetical protein
MPIIEGPGPDALADRSRQELCVLGREYLLIGHLQDRVGLPLATQLVGEEAQVQLSIDEWMGASPIYSIRMQEALRFKGNDVGTVFKNLQVEIGAPPQFMDFQFRLDRPDYGEFWLAHCGALLDVEPFGEKRVKRMCWDIEDPTFDATAAATHPCMKMRPIHRPPRIDAPDGNGVGKWPHCRWAVYIDGEGTAYEQHPNLPRMRESRVADIPIELPAADREPGGWKDYSGAFDPGFQLEDLSHRALLAVCQEAAVQAHLLGRSLILNIDQRHGEDAARALGRGLATGAAAVGAHRLKRALGLAEDIEAIVEIFRLHPHFMPRTYVDLRAEVIGEKAARIEIHDCPALEEADLHSWFACLGDDCPPSIQAIATMVNPRAFVRPAEKRNAHFAWEVVIDPTAEPQEEPKEMKISRISRGVEFELMQRRPLRN